jgi:AcrR family transcriptional regulator
MKAAQTISLRDKHAAATRDHILNEAYELLVNHPDQPFSHEAIAARAGVGARTVYRYFLAQSDLYEELWVWVRKEAGTIFPSSEAQILCRERLGSLRQRYGNSDKHWPPARVLLSSASSHMSATAETMHQCANAVLQHCGELARLKIGRHRKKSSWTPLQEPNHLLIS